MKLIYFDINFDVIYIIIVLFRFGRWELTDEWSKNRGPDPMFEYKEFRSNILDSLEDKIFDKPLCEVMHNQKYFNGIGNYLRAEIIFRSVRKKNNILFCSDEYMLRGGWTGQGIGGFWKYYSGVQIYPSFGPRFWTLRVKKKFLPTFRTKGEILTVDLVNKS